MSTPLPTHSRLHDRFTGAADAGPGSHHARRDLRDMPPQHQTIDDIPPLQFRERAGATDEQWLMSAIQNVERIRGEFNDAANEMINYFQEAVNVAKELSMERTSFTPSPTTTPHIPAKPAVPTSFPQTPAKPTPPSSNSLPGSIYVRAWCSRALHWRSFPLRARHTLRRRRLTLRQSLPSEVTLCQTLMR